MDRPWFDPETGILILDEYVAEMPSFKKVMADGMITADEIADHAQKVASLLQQLEALLTPDGKRVATDALCELAVLYALRSKHLEHSF